MLGVTYTSNTHQYVYINVAIYPYAKGYQLHVGYIVIETVYQSVTAEAKMDLSLLSVAASCIS